MSSKDAYLIYSVRKGDDIFKRYDAQFKARATPYFDGSTKPAPDLWEKVVAGLDEEIAEDEKVLEKMVDKEEAAKAVPSK